MILRHVFHQFFCILCLTIGSAAATVQPGIVRLTWEDTSPDETGFIIERLTGGSYIQVGTVGANAENYTDAGLLTGVSYCYRIRAFNSFGASAPSNSACATAVPGTSTSGSSPSAPATLTAALPADSRALHASTQRTEWSDYRVRLNASTTDNGAMGVMFRYQNNENYYRFSWHIGDKIRRLEKRIGGQFTTLAQDSVQHHVGRTYTVQIVANGAAIEVLVDGRSVFSVIDSSLSAGTIALYSSQNAGSRFDDILVEDLANRAILLAANFTDRRSLGWSFVDEGIDGSPSQWSAATGSLVQSSQIGSSGIGDPGSYALYTRRNWRDYRIALRIGATEDSIRVAFRFQDSENHYFFSWGGRSMGRRLYKRENGINELLAEDAVALVPGRTYQLEIVAHGSSLNLTLNGSPLFAVRDKTHRSGTVALYSPANHCESCFDVVVEELATNMTLLVDRFDATTHSRSMRFAYAGNLKLLAPMREGVQNTHTAHRAIQSLFIY